MAVWRTCTVKSSWPAPGATRISRAVREIAYEPSCVSPLAAFEASRSPIDNFTRENTAAEQQIVWPGSATKGVPHWGDGIITIVLKLCRVSVFPLVWLDKRCMLAHLTQVMLFPLDEFKSIFLNWNNGIIMWRSFCRWILRVSKMYCFSLKASSISVLF